MSRISIWLLGRFQARVGDRDLRGLGGRKVQELICYVLLFRERCHHREVLAETLWGSSAGAQSRKYLRQALWQLRELTGAPGLGRQLLRMDAQWIEVSQEADFWLDVAELEAAFNLAQGAGGEQLTERQTAVLRRAVEAYRGELLEGCYEDWCVYERERLKTMYLALLEKLLIDCQQRGRVGEGVSYGQRILRHDRAHESTHRRMMWLHHVAGNRTTAMRQFHHCADVLKQELGVEPAPATIALYEQIRDSESPPASALALPPGIAWEAAGRYAEQQFLERVLNLLAEAESAVKDRLHDIHRHMTG
jgi:DNA-binding SARP family transcriptional activator